MTNYEKIKDMSIEEMAEMFTNLFCEDHDIDDNAPIKKHLIDSIQKWLKEGRKE